MRESGNPQGRNGMKILVSACLLGEDCKYDGGNNFNEAVLALTAKHELVPVCPEVLGGLPIPRVPCEIVGELVVSREGENVDDQFRRGARKALEIALENDVDLAILQPRSPSCGVRQRYDGTFSGRKIPGSGIFAQLLHDRGIPATDLVQSEQDLLQFIERYKKP